MKKSFIIYVLLTLVLWQFCISLSKIITAPYCKIDNPLFSIVKTTNSGAAFGIMENNAVVLAILGIFVILLVSFLVYKNLTLQDKNKLLYSAVFVSGILGNTMERINLGYVNDFIKINLFDFPIFNLFDILICISFLLLAVNEVCFGKK